MSLRMATTSTFLRLFAFLAAATLAGALRGFAAEAPDNWLAVVRSMPYRDSQGVAANLTTVRRWVLFSESYCGNVDRHLLLDRQWRFLGYIDNGATAAETTARLNDTRRRLAGGERRGHHRRDPSCCRPPSRRDLGGRLVRGARGSARRGT